MQAADAVAAGRRHGMVVTVLFAENNALEQIHQIYKFVHAPEAERPLAIIVEAVSQDGMERLGRNALKAGIGWIDQQWRLPYIHNLRRERPTALLASVSVDEEEIGRLQARQVKTLLGGEGAVLVCQGPPESPPAIGRAAGFQSEMKGSQIVVKGVLTGDWTTRGAESALLGWLRLKTSESGVDLVASQNDSMALGARKAIRSQRPDWAKVAFIGCDGLPEEGIRLVDTGELKATIIKPTTTGAAVEMVAKAVRAQAAGADLVLEARSYPRFEDLAAL